MKRIILASESPRRRELMMKLEIPFTTKPPYVEEIFDSSKSISSAIEAIAKQKADAVREKFPDEIIVGADTVVVVDQEVLGKPHTKENALLMLKKLSGRTHEVITAVAIVTPEQSDVFHVRTYVTFFELTQEEMEQYADTKEPLDKAGAYGIQGKGAFFIEKIEGDYYNVIGLPISTLFRRLKKYIEM